MTLLSLITRHLFSLLTALVIIVNLGFWMPFVFVLALLKLLFGGSPPVLASVNWLTEMIYRIAAAIDSLWMIKVVGVSFKVEGALPDHPAPIIVVNHQTWFDIPIMQYVVTWNGPILKFLIKRQLIRVPVVGWICYALNFPRLNRGVGEDARERDYAAIQAASGALTKERGALLIFAEGTRFTPEKHRHQNSPYRHLLTPRPGGLKIALSTAPAGTPVVDVTIDYGGGDTNFWRCLHGANRHIRIVIRNYLAEDIADVREWLEARWEEKDGLLGNL